MNANTFFIAVGLLLGTIFVFFKPLEISKDNPNEVAQLELENFTVFELTREGLKSITKGTKGKRFENRNEADDINFTDNANEFAQNMQADFGRQQNGIVDLEGNVRYKREDGLRFKSEEARYDQNSTIATTQGAFNMSYGQNWVDGTKLYYDATSRHSRAEGVSGVYKISKEK